MSEQHWNVGTAFEQIEKCSFECEGGALENNVAYRWLKAALTEIGPKYLPGQGVYFEVAAEVGGIKISQWGHFYVVGVTMDSDCDRRFWKYALSSDPPAPYHYGTTNFSNVREEKLSLCLAPPSGTPINDGVGNE